MEHNSAVDAGKINNTVPTVEHQISVKEESDKLPKAFTSVSRDSETYCMNNCRRGHALIFNNSEFNDGNDKRLGSDVDVKRLTDTFQAKGFKVEPFQDLCYEEIMNVLSEYSQKDQSDCDCLIITIMTHGLSNGYLCSKDHPYLFNQVWAHFTNNNCLTLAGKPKIFIIQACRGKNVDPGITMERRGSFTMTDSIMSESYRIPTMSDFLFAFSTPEGFYSWRDPIRGSWFIQAICDALEKYPNYDFLKILTRASLMVATQYMSDFPTDKSLHQKLEVPCIHSTLLRDIFF